MIFIGLAIAAVILGFLGVVFTRIGISRGIKCCGDEPNIRDAGWICFVVAVIITFVLMLVISLTYTMNLAKIAKLEAFYEANLENFEVTYVEGKTLFSLDNEEIASLIAIEGSIEKLKLGDKIVTNLTELRNACNEYNTQRAHLIKMRSNWAYPGIFIYPDASYLKPLVMELK